MNLRPRKFARVGYLALLVFTAACDGVGGDEQVEQVEEVTARHASALVPGTGAGGAGASLDSLTTYTARCEAATGIHVPTFDCNDTAKSAEVPQGNSFDAVETDVAIPLSTPGMRSGKPPAPIAPNPPTSLLQTIVSGGFDIAGSADQFFYSYQTHSPQGTDEAATGTAEVLVTTVPTSDPGAKAGLMLRQSTDPGSAFFMVGVTAAKGVFFETRMSTGAGANTSALVTVSTPIWLRLMWNDAPTLPGQTSNNRVAAFYSTNHTTWTSVGDVTFPQIGSGVPFPFTGLIGLAVTSHKASTNATAVFDKFTTTKFCDTPNVLNGKCDPRSRFQVVAQTADAIVVANCRKEGSIDNTHFKDIAVIQYNRKNGAVCYYQSPNTELDASNVTTPSLGNTGTGIFPWLAPKDTRHVGCTGCHDNGPFIRSQYLYQLTNFPLGSDGYDNNYKKLAYVGLDFARDRSWYIHGKNAGGAIDDSVLLDGTDNSTYGVCNSCHSVSVNNVGDAAAGPYLGTGLKFVTAATADHQASRNPFSTASPIWMRPDSAYPTTGPGSELRYVYAAPAAATAGHFNTCATTFDSSGFNPNDPSVLASNCSFTPNGVPYQTTLTSTIETSVGIVPPAGSGSGTLEFSTINAPANTDVTDVSDKFFWTYANQGGDGTAVVKVTRLDPSDPYAKAGIMIREGVGVNAVNAMIAVTAGHGPTFQYRPTMGATTVASYLPTYPSGLPVWLRLARTGRTWVGSASYDGGNSWTQVGTPVTLTNLITPYLGLVATARSMNTATRADFESFEWTPATGWTLPDDPHLLVDGRIFGAGGSSGSRVEARTQETITSSGGDITSTSDNFNFAAKTFGGDGIAITEVTSQTAVAGTLDPYAKAGLMARETASPDSANVFVGKTNSGATIQSRTTAGGTTTPTNVAEPTLPYWFRLLRTGNTFIGSMSPDGSHWTQVGDPAVFTTFSPSPLYGLAVSSHSPTTVTKAIFDSGATPEPPGFQWSYGLPAGWIDASMGTTGSHQTSGATEVITGSGTDIYSYSDQFFYAWKNITGNATIIAQVTALSLVGTPPGSPNGYAKAGVMFRDSATGGAPNALMTLTAAQGSSFQYRPTPGVLTATPSFATGSIGYWVKLVRSGASSNVFTGYVSPNGTPSSWVPVGSPVTLNTIAQTALVGMAVTSHDSGRTVQATFANVSITQP